MSGRTLLGSSGLETSCGWTESGVFAGLEQLRVAGRFSSCSPRVSPSAFPIQASLVQVGSWSGSLREVRLLPRRHCDPA